MTERETTIRDLKKHYNTLIKRYKAGSKYLDNNSIPLKERKKWIKEYRDIMEIIGGFLREFKKIGVRVTEDEIFNGFKLDKP